MSHLHQRRVADLKGDIAENYHGEVVLLSHEGAHHGHDGVRELASILDRYVEVVDYQVIQPTISDRFAYLRWRIEGEQTTAHKGVDTFVIEESEIVAQTIHYGLTDEPRSPGSTHSSSRIWGG